MCPCIALVFAKKINLYLSTSNMDPICRPKCAGSRRVVRKLTPCRRKITCSSAQDHKSCHQTQIECTPLMVGNYIPHVSFKPTCNLEGMFVPPEFMCSKTSKLHFSAKVHVFKELKTSLLSKSSCIHLGLLEKDWPRSRLLTIDSLSLPTENNKRTPVPCARDWNSAKSKLLERLKEVLWVLAGPC